VVTAQILAEIQKSWKSCDGGKAFSEVTDFSSSLLRPNSLDRSSPSSEESPSLVHRSCWNTSSIGILSKSTVSLLMASRPAFLSGSFMVSSFELQISVIVTDAPSSLFRFACVNTAFSSFSDSGLLQVCCCCCCCQIPTVCIRSRDLSIFRSFTR
jgi:hypothetical protein